MAGSTRSSESSIADVQKPYAQKVRGSGGPEGNEFVAELEGDFIGLGLSNVKAPVDNKKARDAARKKGKRSPDTEAMAQAIVQESRVPPRKRKLRVLSLGSYFSQVLAVPSTYFYDQTGAAFVVIHPWLFCRT